MNWLTTTLLYVSLLSLLTPFALGQSSVWSGESNVANYRIGSHVLACDINNDNYYDIVSTGLNGVYVWLGGPFGHINSTADYMIDIYVPSINTDGLGLECADINMDGYADVLVGNWTASNPNVRIFTGSATGLNTVSTGFGISSANYYGAELAVADYNNDGKMDLAVGAYGAARVYFHYGLGTSGLNPSYSAPAELQWPTITYAQNLNPCDLSNDGYPDLLIGCRSCNSQYGVLFIASNVGGVWTHAQIWNGTAAGGFFAFDAKCGDFNGDGNKDIAIISQGASTMEIHYGTGDIMTIAREPNVTLTLGASCRSISVADLNADGYDDIVGGFNAINQAKLFMGGPTLVTGSSASYSYQGPAGGSGWKVAALPNLDGLGNKDVAFGTFVFSNGQASEGSVTVLYNLGSSIAPSVSPSRTPSPSVTPSATPSNTPTPSVTPSPSMSPSVTPTQTPSSSPTNSPTASATPTASRTPSPSISPSHSITPSITPSNSVSSSPQSDSSANKGLDPTIVISVAIGVPIISCTFFGSVLAILLIRRRKNKQANTELPMADVKEPSRPSSPGSSASPIDMFTRSGSFSGSAPNIVIPVVTKKSNSLEEDNSNYASMPSGIDDNTSGSRSTGTGARSASGRTASKRNILPKEQDWEIPYSELKSLTKIGSGAFGEVYRGRWKGVDVAVKKILHSAEPDDKSDIKLQDFFAEAELMRKLKPHPNITQLLGVVIHPLCIVTEFIANGSLYSYLQSKKEMSDEMKLTIIKGTAAGMLHLHSQGVVHRDLAARNILLDGTLRPKVCDFGMSRVVIDNRSNSTENAVGPIKWMSPESLTSRLYSTKSDVWSFGVVIFEILTRENPYHGYNLMQIGTKVAMGTLSLVTELENTGVKYPDNVVEVFKMCLEFKAQNRPEFEDIVNMLD